jgi:hypothetical protein
MSTAILNKNVTTEAICNFYMLTKRIGLCFKFGLGKKIVNRRLITKKLA